MNRNMYTDGFKASQYERKKCVFTFTQFKLHKDLKMDFFASDYLIHQLKKK